MKKKRIKTTKKPDKNCRRIPGSATKHKLIKDESTVVFSFRYACDRHCLLYKWAEDELKALVRKFKEMEELTWDRIRLSRGLKI
jgi:hypothetical protein